MIKRIGIFLVVGLIAGAAWWVTSANRRLPAEQAGKAQSPEQATAALHPAARPASSSAPTTSEPPAPIPAATAKLWGAFAQSAGSGLDRNSPDYLAAQAKGNAPVGRATWLEAQRVPSFAALAPGQQVAVPLPDGTEKLATIRSIDQAAPGVIRMAGDLAGKQGSFVLMQQAGGLSGRILLPVEKRAVLVHPVASGRTVLQEVPISAVLCESLPREPQSWRKTAQAAAGKPAPETTAPILSSRPSSQNILYLDFDGATVNDPDWPAYAADGVTVTGSTIVAPASGLSAAEITEVWNRVKEDYWPFDVDVTTDAARYSSAAVGKRMRVIITPNDAASPGAGGVAYVGSFVTSNAAFVGFTYFQADVPAWVFNTSVDGVAEAISHELGHTLGLHHDGLNPPAVGHSTTDGEYYYGHGDSSSAVGWAPIMGAGYYEKLVQWSKGEYPGATNQQDDVGILGGVISYQMIPSYQDPAHPGDPNYYYPGLSGTNPVSYVADDAGNTRATATAINVASGSLNLAGIVSSAADSDFYSFTLAAATTVTITANPPSTYTKQANLDVLLELQNSGGTVVASANPDGSLNASLTYGASAGTYYIRVSGTGRAGSGSDYGYTNYGSIGQYTLQGTFGPIGVPVITSATTASIGVGNSFSYAITATNFPASFAATGLPPGLSIVSGTGVISGRPTAIGTYNIGLSATNAAGTGSGSLVLTVTDSSPAVTSQTIGRQLVVPSGNLTLSATVFSVNGSISYQWVHDGQPIAGGTSNSLNLTAATMADSGVYWLVSTNSIGSSRSKPVFVVVAPTRTQLRGWGWGNDGQLAAPATLTRAVRVSAGVAYSLAANADGTVVAWGHDNHPESLVPAGLNEVVAVAAGYQHSVALKGDATVVAWGATYYGQANPPAGLSDVVAITSGINHALALKSDGTVVAWGHNGFGQTAIPPGLTGVVAVAAGDNHSLALKNDGTVVAWGDNSSGQSTVPAGLTGVKAITAGTDFSLAFKNDGTVVGWGSNASGQITIPAGLSGVATFDAGVAHALALKSSGVVVAWGYNGNNESAPPADLTGVFAISAGNAFSLALRDASSDTAPQISINPTSQTVTEGQAVTLTVTATGAGPLSYQWRKAGVPLAGATAPSLTISPVVPTSAGSYDVVVTNHIGSTTSTSATLTIAALPNITGLSTPRQVLVPGQNLNLAVTATGTGTLHYQWFQNGRALSGKTAASLTATNLTYQDSGWYVVDITDDNGTRRSAPIFVTVAPMSTRIVGWGSSTYTGQNIPAGLNDAVAVASGEVHMLALKRDGTVVGWGNNQDGRATPPAGLSGVVAIAAGPFHSLALKSDGTVVSWGWYFSGWNPPPAGLTNVVAIAASESRSMALKSDGTIVIWGASAPVPAGISGVVGIGLGRSQLLVLKADGTVVSWRDNSATPSALPAGVNNVAAISANFLHAVVRKNDGTVVAWAYDGTVQPGTTVPAGLSGVVEAKAGTFNSLVVKADQTVVAWGENSSGQSSPPSDLGNVFMVAAGSGASFALRDATADTGPVISTQPTNVTVAEHQPATFTVIASGSGPITYQWRKGGVPISGATAATFTIAETSLADSGSYDVVVTNQVGSNPSVSVTLTVNPVPVITNTSALRQVISTGSPFTVAATATGTGSLSYQWIHNGRVIAGATASSYTVPTASYQDGGWYLVLVTDSFGTQRGKAMFVNVAPLVTQVRAWGYSSNAATVVPAGLTDAVSISAGSNVSASALRRDGTVVAWGENLQGQTNIPAGLNNVVATSAGYYHTLALKSNGTVIGWGNSTSSQLAIPAGLVDVVAIAAGTAHSVALKSDGKVVAWGTDYANASTVPPGLTGVVAIAAGGYHTLALKDDGTVIAWGYNDSGQSSVPAGLTGVVAISAGAVHSLALKSDGTVVAWGYAVDGATAVPAGLNNVIMIAAGQTHNLALKSDGTLVGWGRNTFGEASPPAGGLDGVLAISAGYFCSMVLRDSGSSSTPAISGQPSSQTGGYGTNITFSVTSSGTPAPTYQWQRLPAGGSTWSNVTDGGVYSGSTTASLTVTGATLTMGGDQFRCVVSNTAGSVTSNAALLSVTPPAIMKISAGRYHSLRMDGLSRLLVAGGNSAGQLGKGDTTNSNSAQVVTISSETLVDVAAGSEHSLVLTRFRRLFAAGLNDRGQLGDGTTTARSTPVQVATDVLAMSGGLKHTAFIKTDGTLLTVGYNDEGQLGNGTMSGETPNVTPAAIATNVVDVSAGTRQTLFLKNNGTLWGTGDMYNTATLVSTPIQLATGVKTFAAGGYHSAFVKSDGTLWSMGFNGDGQLGTGNTATATTPVQVATNVKTVAAAFFHTLFIKNDGTLWAMGKNDAGQLGTGDTTSRSTAVQIATNVAAVTTNQTYTLFTKTNGTLWAMGANATGVFGNGGTTGSTTPVQVASGAGAPATPPGGGITASNITGGIHLFWDPQADATEYEVWRGTDYNGTDAVKIASGLRWSLYDDLTAVAGVSYYYRVKAVNPAGASAAGTPVGATYTPPGLPVITTHPQGQSISVGTPLNVSVVATGTGLTYQWRKGGTNIPGATASSYTINNAIPTDAGMYDVVVTSPAGSVTSQTAQVSVTNTSCVIAITAGTAHSLFIKADGSAWGMGWNVNGALTGTAANYPRPLRLVNDPVAAVAAGDKHSLILLTDGRLLGLGNRAALGEGSGNYTTPVQIDTGVAAIAAGSNHSLFLKQDGTLVIRGTSLTGVPSNIVRIAAGGNTSALITRDGTLWMAGENGLGQLGQGHRTNTTAFVQAAWGVRDVSVGSQHTLFIKDNSMLLGMGSREAIPNSQSTDILTPLVLDSGTAKVSASNRTSLYINDEQALWAMGVNSQGQFGDGSLSSVPVRPSASIGGNYVAVAGGESGYALFLKPSGGLFASGANDQGQLGDGTINARRTAVELVSGGALIPTAPATVAATDGTLPHVRVTWAHAAGASAYEVWRGTTNASADAILVAGDIGVNFYLDSPPAAGTTYYYWVKAKNLIGTSDFGGVDTGAAAAGSLPTWAMQPVNQAATFGGSVSFVAGAVANPTATYQWQIQFPNDNGSTWTNLNDITVHVGARTAELQLLGVTSPMNGNKYRCVATNSAGSITSSVATLTVTSSMVAPSITTQPSSQTITGGGNASFTVAANGTPTPAYQWQRLPSGSGTWANLTDGGIYSGATTATLTLTAAATGSNGDQFRAIATNTAGSATSNAATLTVNAAAVAPSITTQPSDQAVKFGGTATFAVVGSGTPTLSYRWQVLQTPSWSWVDLIGGGFYNGTASATMTVTASTTALRGQQFRCVVTNSSGSVISNQATLTVNPDDDYAVLKFAAGRFHSTRLNAIGAVTAVGTNAVGQLGTGNTTSATSPATITIAGQTVTDVAAWSQHTLFLTSTGQVWGTGLNDHGQLGTGGNKLAPVQLATGASGIGVGSMHTAILKSDGTLWTMGGNDGGQLGNGNMTDTSSLVQIASNVAKVAVGTRQTLFLKTDGTLWGTGDLYGTSTLYSTPVQLASSVVQIAAGGYHSAFVKTDGTLWTLGYNPYGQLGNGNTTTVTTPVQVASNVATVTAGFFHTLFIKTDWTLWAMGYNSSGQLGDGTTTNRLTPFQVSTEVTAVKANLDYTLFTMTDGSLWAVGNNASGQFGNGSTSGSLVPVTIVTPQTSSAPAFTGQPTGQTITAGGNASFTVATTGLPRPAFQWQRLPSGSVTWVDISDGGIYFGTAMATLTLTAATTDLSGDQFRCVATNRAGSATSNAATLTVNVVAGGPAITTQPSDQTVTVGSNATFTVAASGTPTLAYQWQQLLMPSGVWIGIGNGGDFSGTTTATMTVTASLVGYSGQQYRCVVTNSAGSANSNAATLTVNPAGSTAVTKFAAGRYHSTRLNASSVLSAVGNNAVGQLGTGGTVSTPTPAVVTIGGQTVTDVSAWSQHTLLLTSTGDVYGTGLNDHGQLRGGGNQLSPSQLTTGASAIGAGLMHSVVLKADGTLWTVGGNDEGQLGNGNMTDTINFVQIATGVAKISAGTRQTLFIKTDGTLWGTGDLYNTATLYTTPVQLATNVTDVAAGGYHSLYLKADGTLWSVGYNFYGQLGNGTTNTTTSPVQIASGVTGVAAGFFHSLYIKADGSLWAVGSNSSGQLGDGTTTNRLTPVQVATGVTAVKASLDYTLFTKTDGSLWAMGGNASGQFGNGSTAGYPVPVKIVTPTGGNVAPTITTQPSNQTITAGGNTSFTVAASGTPTPTYQWQRLPSGSGTWANVADGGIYSGATTGTLTLTAVTIGANSDQFRAVATNTSGSATSNAAILTVNPAPVAPAITTQPTNQTITASNNASFTVAASGTPTPTYQWQRLPAGSGTWTNVTNGGIYSGATTVTLTITAATTGSNGDQFRAVATNSAGSATSNAATLAVNAPNVAPTITTQPSNQAIVAGTNTSFTVTASGTPAPTYQWQRLPAGSGTWANLANGGVYAGATSATLTLTAVPLGQNGDQFRCVATNAINSASSNAATLTVSPLLTTAIIKLAAARYHSTRVSGTAATTATGNNVYGQLGNGNTTLSLAPVDVVISGQTVADASAWSQHTVFLTAAGQVWGAGLNDFGQLGTGGNKTSPVQLATGSVGTSAGLMHTAILKADGTLWTMGGNDEGQLGNGTMTNSSTLVLIATDVKDVSAGTRQTLFLKTDGTLWGAGDLYGTTTLNTTPVQIATNVVTMAAGGYHSAFVKADGTLWTLGYNPYGQLGNGTTTTATTPVQVTSGVRAVTAGYFHTIFLKTDGTLWSMGYNATGQLGDGTTTNRTTPVQVAANVTAASATFEYTLFTKADGTLWATGSNVYGQYGNGLTTSSSVPLQVAAGNPGVPVAASTVVTVGATATNRVRLTWAPLASASGYEIWRATTNDLTAATRVANAHWSIFDDLTGAAGTAYYYWVKPFNGAGVGAAYPSVSGTYAGASAVIPAITTQPTDQTISAGGNASFSVVASGTPVPTYQWQRLPSGGSWANVSNGGIYSGATTATLTVTAATTGSTGDQFRCVATNSAGSATSNPATLTVNVANVAPAITTQPSNQTINAGANASFTVAASGTPAPTYQWQSLPAGSGTWSNLADGNGYSGVTTVTLTITAASTGLTGNQFRCIATNVAGSATSNPATLAVNAVTVAPVITTQPSNQTITDNGSTTFTVAASGTPAPTYQWQRFPAGGSAWANVADGGIYSGATTATLMLTAATTASSGDQFRAVATNTAGSATSNAATLTVNAGGGSSGVLKFAAGRYHSARVASGGTASAAGNNAVGQLGVGSTTSTLIPVPVTISGQTVSDVSAWSQHTLFLTAAGQVWGSGLNDHGQLGVSGNQLSPAQLTTGGSAIGTGVMHSVVLKTDGTLWTLGGNDEGQLGNGTMTDTTTLVQIATGVAKVSAGTRQTLFIKTDGTLWGTGDVYGTTTLYTTPVQLAANVAEVAAGGYHSLFVKTDGTLWALGYNPYGQLGNGTTTTATSPVQVASGVTGVAAGFFHSLFIKTDGSLWAMGYNPGGQLGDGTTTNRLTPVQVAAGVTAVKASFDYTLFTKSDGSLWAMGGNASGQFGNSTTAGSLVPVKVLTPSGPTAPAITLQPANQAITAGGNVSFTVAASGTPAPTYQWQRFPAGGSAWANVSNGGIYSGATSATLTLTAATIGADGDQFRAVATNTAGGATSGPATLTVTAAPVAPAITTQPSNQTINAGGNASFTVAASGTPAPTYQWQRFPAGGSAWANVSNGGIYSGATTATLTLTAASAGANGDQFRALATNAGGSATSNAATLTVNTPAAAPAITTQPTGQSITVGGNTTFIVAASGAPAPSYQWQRLPSGSGTWADVTNTGAYSGTTTTALTITAATGGMSGDQFRAVATNASGSATSNAATLTVSANTGIAKLAAARYYSVRLDSSGGVFATGSNAAGQLGTGNTTNALLPVTIAIAGQTITDVSAWSQHTLFLTASGQVWGTGLNDHGQLGTGGNKLSPVQLATGASGIGAGLMHSAILKSDGTLWTIGGNDEGQLGNGNMTDSTALVQIASGVVEVSAGTRQTLFRKSDGTLWGAGDLYGTTTLVTTPVQIASNVATMAAGGYHSAFVKTDGTLWTLGYNLYGQLGNGTTATATSPVQVASGVAAVAAGFFHTLFVKTDGTLWAMGMNANGQLGDGTTTNRTTPVQVASGVAAVKASFEYTLFTKTDGSLWATGGNASGQFGNGTTNGVVTPLQLAIGGSAAAPAFTMQPGGQSVTAGANVTLVVAASGTPTPTYQWQRLPAGSGTWANLANGGAYSGVTTASLTITGTTVGMNGDQFRAVATNTAGGATSGNATLTVVALNVAPTIPEQPSNITAETGSNINVGIAVAGSVPMTYLWQELIGATWTDRPGYPSTSNNLSNFSGVGVVTVADSGRQFRCIASNAAGSVTSNTITLTVVPVFTITYSAAAGGADHAVVVRANGAVYGMGGNTVGQLGDGTVVNRLAPVAMTVLTSGVTQVSAGVRHTLLLKSDGTAWSVGGNGNSQLGDGTTTGRTNPVQIASNIAMVEAGTYCGFILSNSGVLSGFGYGGYGQLGSGTTANAVSPRQIATNVSTVSAGDQHMLFVKTDGTVWAVGTNTIRQLGDGTTTDRLTPVQIATGGSKVAAGGFHSLLLKQDNTLWAFGYNADGELGIGNTTTAPSPVQVTTGVAKIAAGLAHSAFVKQDGTLWTMGDNSYGQLGDGTTTDRILPVQVATGVASVYVGDDFTIFIKTDGTLWRMGRNHAGQLGDGSTGNRLAPVQF